jgi:PAS domain-containing protein
MHDFSKVQSAMSTEWGFHPQVAQLYAAHYGSIDVWRAAVTTGLGFPSSLSGPPHIGRTEFYNDLLRPYAIPHGMFAMVERAPGRVANLSICRSARGGPFDERDLEILRFLKPHIRRAYRLHSEIAEARARSNGLLAALNAIPGGVILLDPQMRVITMNLVAEQILAAGNGLRIRRQRLRAEHTGESARLERLVGEAVATSQGNGLKSAGSTIISRRDFPPLQVLISPIRCAMVQMSQQIAAVAFINDPLRHQRPAQETLRCNMG